MDTLVHMVEPWRATNTNLKHSPLNYLQLALIANVRPQNGPAEHEHCSLFEHQKVSSGSLSQRPLCDTAHCCSGLNWTSPEKITGPCAEALKSIHLTLCGAAVSWDGWETIVKTGVSHTSVFIVAITVGSRTAIFRKLTRRGLVKRTETCTAAQETQYRVTDVVFSRGVSPKNTLFCTSTLYWTGLFTSLTQPNFWKWLFSLPKDYCKDIIVHSWFDYGYCRHICIVLKFTYSNTN